MLMIELDNHLMMYHHHLKDLLMVNLVHVLLNDVQDLFVEQNVDHINDMEIFFLDYEYFEYDVEDWMKLKMIVHNICNDMAEKEKQNLIFNFELSFTCSPVCVRKCRVKFAERGKTFPQ